MSDQVAEMSATYLVEAAQGAVPVGYKQTEVGVIPEDWQLDKISNLVSITTGSKNTQDKVIDGLYPFFVRSQQIERINTFSFDGEAVLTAGDGVGTGKIFHYINSKFDFHQRVYLMYNFSEKIDGYYFYIFFSNNFYERIMSMTAKSSVDSVRREMIAEMPLVLPPKKEQTAIANALSDVDALISELEKLIAKKQSIKTATMQQLLTGRTRLPQFSLREDGAPKGYKQSELGEIPEDWEVRCLGNFAIYLGSGKTNTKSKGDFPLYGSTGLIGSSKNPEYDGEAILVARVGANAGRLNFVSGKYGVSDNTIIIKFNTNSDVHFFRYLMIRKNLNTLVFGSGQPLITGSQLKELLFSLPHKEEQTAIANVLSDMDEDILALEQRLGKTRQLKQGMMQELLTGKTRLLKPAA